VGSIHQKGVFNKLSGKSTQIGYAVLLSFLVVCCGVQITKTETATATVTSSPAATLDPKAALRESIIQVLGTGNRQLPRLTKISYSVPEAGDITITWALNDTVSQNSRIANAQIDATNILKVLENNKTRFIYVILIGTFSMQDEYGTTAEIQAINLGFNKSKLDKINWEDFQPADIYDLADIANIADEWK
jgi:hypothetical protein